MFKVNDRSNQRAVCARAAVAVESISRTNMRQSEMNRSIFIHKKNWDRIIIIWIDLS